MIPLIVNSCAAFSDTWLPWVALHHRFWPDCPYDLVLVTDLDVRDSRHTGWDQVVGLGHDWEWCKNLDFAIDELGNPEFVMLTQDDFWLCHPVDNALVEQAYSYLSGNTAVGCIRMSCNPPACTEMDGLPATFGVHAPGRMYRTSAAPAIWRTSYLRKMLLGNRTVMDFYLRGPLSEPELVLAQFKYNHAVPFIDSAIERGSWNGRVLEWAQSVGVAVDTSRRPIDEDCPDRLRQVWEELPADSE